MLLICAFAEEGRLLPDDSDTTRGKRTNKESERGTVGGPISLWHVCIDLRGKRDTTARAAGRLHLTARYVKLLSDDIENSYGTCRTQEADQTRTSYMTMRLSRPHNTQTPPAAKWKRTGDAGTNVFPSYRSQNSLQILSSHQPPLQRAAPSRILQKL
jgi:hypothetical protein